jgi:hypothetical protein
MRAIGPVLGMAVRKDVATIANARMRHQAIGCSPAGLGPVFERTHVRDAPRLGAKM